MRIATIGNLTTASISFDMMRAIAAAFVCLGHIRGLYFIDYNAIKNPTVLHSIFYAAGSLGHDAVVIFFVLSGFFIGRQVLVDAFENKFSWSAYVIQRLCRLYVVLVPALLVCAALDHLGVNLFGPTSIYYGDRLGSQVIPHELISAMSVQTFFGNLFFLQKILVEPFGSDTPLWSLSFEFFYYLLFPCIIMAIKAARPQLRVYNVLAGVLIFWLLTPEIRQYFIIWLIGAAVAVVPAYGFKQVSAPVQQWLVAFALLVALAISHKVHGFSGDLIVALATVLLIYVHLSTNKGIETETPSATFAKVGAGFSYSLYLVHLPVLVFLRNVLVANQRWTLDLSSVICALVLMMLCLLYAYLFSRVTEAKTGQIRRFVTKKLSQFSLRKKKLAAKPAIDDN